MSENGRRILVALDYPDLVSAALIAEPLRQRVGFKVGMQLNTAAGTPAVIHRLGTDVFLDLKFHDIPNTVAGAVTAAAKHGVKMLNVHCLGGLEMMRAARGAADKVFIETGGYRPLVIGVTVLTSQNRESLRQVGIDPSLSVDEAVMRLSMLAVEAGLDGVVSSPQEITSIRRTVCDHGFLIVTPGIRRKDAKPDDQRRTMTAREAIDHGADYLVIGRPITGAPDPLEAAEEFIEEIS